MPKGTPFDLETKHRAIALVKEGILSTQQIADVVGCTDGSVRRWVRYYKQHGTPLSPSEVALERRINHPLIKAARPWWAIWRKH